MPIYEVEYENGMYWNGEHRPCGTTVEIDNARTVANLQDRGIIGTKTLKEHRKTPAPPPEKTQAPRRRKARSQQPVSEIGSDPGIHPFPNAVEVTDAPEDSPPPVTGAIGMSPEPVTTDPEPGVTSALQTEPVEGKAGGVVRTPKKATKKAAKKTGKKTGK